MRLTHAGLETFPKLPAFARENFMQGWTSLIGSGLKDFVEKGGDTSDREIVIAREFASAARTGLGGDDESETRRELVGAARFYDDN